MNWETCDFHNKYDCISAQEVEPPVLAPVSSIMGEILFASLTSDRHIQLELRSVATTEIRRRVLSVAGVLAGILFRVRSYLYMGAGFLGLVVFSMIWHAAVDREQTWIWWASGVALGIAILALFAVFEKRRAQMLHALEKLRAWSA